MFPCSTITDKICSTITNKILENFSHLNFLFCDIPIRNSGNNKAKFLNIIENRHHPNMFFNENLASSFRDRYPLGHLICF